MTTILTAADQALIRVGLRKILETEAEMSVVGEAGDGEEAVANARQLRPDVALMDIRMPALDGIEPTRRVVRERPNTRVLILTTFGLDTYVYDALRAGASGFMLSSTCSPAVSRTPRSAGSSSSAKRPPKRMSHASSKSSTCATACRR